MVAENTVAESASSEVPSPSPPPTSPEPWPDRLLAVATPCYRWLCRPRVRLTVIGAVLLITGGLLTTNSVWTLPLVLIGALMVVIAWIGHRLDGRFAVEWGEAGTQLAFRAQIKPAQPVLPAVDQAASIPDRRPLGHRVGLGDLPDPPDADVVEGEAHTVEIDVADLKALLAAAEAAEIKVSRTETPERGGSVAPIR
jgi:hypothetical protein